MEKLKSVINVINIIGGHPVQELASKSKELRIALMKFMLVRNALDVTKILILHLQEFVLSGSNVKQDTGKLMTQDAKDVQLGTVGNVIMEPVFVMNVEMEELHS